MRILHTYLNASSFVNKDQALFETLGTVRRFHFNVRKKHLLPFIFIKQFYHLLVYGFRTDIFIVQFAGYHSFLPALFAKVTGKKSVIISGGTDCVSFPGIGYGNFYRPILRDFTKWSYQLATQICPKHESLWLHDYTYDTKEPAKQGIKAFVPDLENKVTVIHNGYDPDKWPLLDLARRKNSFITVSGAFEYPFQVQLKGIDLILQVASQLPECSFTIAGVPEWKKLDVRSNNVTVIPPVKHEELYKLFNQHEFYIQISMAEGFPNALCEAMLCGCTPLVSKVFSMPEIVGRSENVLPVRDPGLFQALITSNLSKKRDPALNRNIIAENFSVKKRAEQLITLLTGKLNPSNNKT